MFLQTLGDVQVCKTPPNGFSNIFLLWAIALLLLVLVKMSITHVFIILVPSFSIISTIHFWICYSEEMQKLNISPRFKVLREINPSTIGKLPSQQLTSSVIIGYNLKTNTNISNNEMQTKLSLSHGIKCIAYLAHFSENWKICYYWNLRCWKWGTYILILSDLHLQPFS